MKTVWVCTITFLTLFDAFCQQPTTDILAFPKYGFEIESLDSQVPGVLGKSISALMLFLPPQDGFAPNVNVLIQPYSAAIEDYVSLSKAQFRQARITIISESRRGDNEWVAEYTGDFQGSTLHWYARAVLTSGKVYLVTATARHLSWRNLSKQLRKCVDSFKVR